MSTSEPTVFLVDDEPAVLCAVARVLRAEGIRTRTFESPREFLGAQHDARAPGCAVLDLAMPGLDGMQIQRTLAAGDATGTPRPVIFLTGHGDVPTSVEAMKQGAVDFLTKPVDAAALLDAVHRAIELDLRMRRERAGATEIQARLGTLTPREREVMAQVVAGKRNKEIAAELGTTEKTIKVHRGRVMAKIGAKSLPDLVRFGEQVQRHPG